MPLQGVGNKYKDVLNNPVLLRISYLQLTLSVLTLEAIYAGSVLRAELSRDLQVSFTKNYFFKLFTSYPYCKYIASTWKFLSFTFEMVGFFLTFEGTVNSRTGCHPPVTRQQFEHVERFGFESDNNLKIYQKCWVIRQVKVLSVSCCHLIVVCLERGGVGFIPFFEFRLSPGPWCLASVCNESGWTAV